MASYIQININTANAPHFATWYHNRSGQAMSFLTCRTKLRNQAAISLNRLRTERHFP